MEDARIQELEAKVAELTAMVERLAQSAPPVSAALVTTRPAVEVVSADETISSRRGMLKLAGAAAAGAVAATVASSVQPAAAANGDPLVQGVSQTATSPTQLIGIFQTLVASANNFILTPAGTEPDVGGANIGWNTTTTVDGNLRAGVVGISSNFIFPGTTSAHGVLGYTNETSVGSAVYGYARGTTAGVSAGVRARSEGGPSIQLVPIVTGPPTTGNWEVGAIQPDTTGRIWYCTATGSPGSWRLLTAPIFVPVGPARVYDSRVAAPSPGIISSGLTRTVSVADQRATDSGAVTGTNIIPAGATAIAANVTVDATTAEGFLAVNPGGTTTVSASTINWFGAGQTLANGVIVPINPSTREVTVIAGGGGTTHFIIDVTGYYI